MPWWDYDAPGTQRDTTAAAVLASGLLELARVDPDPARRATWRAAGLHTLRSLVGPRYLAQGTGAWSVLLHGRHDPTYDDAGVTYGDYYLLEALLRVQLLPSDRPALRPASTGAGCRRRPAGRPRPAGAGSAPSRSAGRPAHSSATRYRVQTSVDGRRWTTVRGGVSSGRTAAFETYDLRDRVTRFVRVVPLGTSTGAPGRVRGCGSAADVAGQRRCVLGVVITVRNPNSTISPVTVSVAEITASSRCSILVFFNRWMVRSLVSV